MTDPTGTPPPPSLATLGWSDFFAGQIGPTEAALLPGRIWGVHRSRLSAMTERGLIPLALPPHGRTTDFTVGDWVLADPDSHLMKRRLERRTVLKRRVEGSDIPQLAGANIDTLFIVTSCNADFNIARLERYLALANQGGAEPVILLTKADLATDPQALRDEAAALQRGLAVVIVDARSPGAAALLAPWCGEGRTVAMVGSSGVGKSTLVNTLAGVGQEQPQVTGAIRENDGKGRHTTTSRSIHAMAGGGWVIDTPGLRTLHISDAAGGLDTLFAEITDLAPHCHFRDCTHVSEPGCAVLAAVAAGTVAPERLERWRKLTMENDAAAARRTAPGSGRSGGRRKAW